MDVCDICGEAKDGCRWFCGDIVCGDCFKELADGDIANNADVFDPDKRDKVHAAIDDRYRPKVGGNSGQAEGPREAQEASQGEEATGG